MKKTQRSGSLAGRITLAVLVILIAGMLVEGIFSYVIYRNDSLADNAERAKDIAQTAASAFLYPEKLMEAFDTGTETEYWKEMKQFLDDTILRTGVTYLYVMDSWYDTKAYYHMEGVPPWEPVTLGLGDSDALEAFTEEMFDTLRTGEPSLTGAYMSEGYGNVVSGFAPILGADRRAVAVVGVDILVDHVLEASNGFAVKTAFIVLGFSLLFGLFTFWYIRRSVGQPLSALTQAFAGISTGDMDVEVDIHARDETGKLADSFRVMLDNMREQVGAMQSIAQGDYSLEVPERSDKDAMNRAINHMLAMTGDTIHQISASAAQVSVGSKQIADGAQALAQGSTEQAAAVERLSASIAEINGKTRQNADIAREAAELSGAIWENSEKGSRQMNEMMDAVREINEASRNIGKVIKVIDNIAFQTNILALNAAVEAARAGQYGKGFAVVAGEVRNLATQSAEAAKETGKLIESSIEKANLGLEIATETSGSLQEIVSGINRSAQIVSQIAQSSEEQAAAIREINTGVDQVAQVVQQNSATAEESAAASEEMSGQSHMLEQLVAQFKVKEGNASPPALPGSSRRTLAMPEKTSYRSRDFHVRFDKE